MSAGAFVSSKYQLDNGRIAAVRVQPETLLLQLGGETNNALLIGTVDLPGRYPLNLGGRNRKPFSARYVSFKWTATPPAGYLLGSLIKLPWLFPTTFNLLQEQDTGTYLGVTIELVGKKAQG